MFVDRLQNNNRKSWLEAKAATRTARTECPHSPLTEYPSPPLFTPLPHAASCDQQSTVACHTHFEALKWRKTLIATRGEIDRKGKHGIEENTLRKIIYTYIGCVCTSGYCVLCLKLLRLLCTTFLNECIDFKLKFPPNLFYANYII